MISNRDKEYLKRAAVELIPNLLRSDAIKHWLLKTADQNVAPEQGYSEADGNYGEYISLIEDESGDFDLEVWIENYPKYGIRNSLWFGLHSLRQRPIKVLIDALKGRPSEPIEWTHQPFPDRMRPIYDPIGPRQYYLGVYEKKTGTRHEPLETFVGRSIDFLNQVCLFLPEEPEAVESNREIERQKRLAEIARRPLQKRFSQMVRRNYGRRCAVTGCFTGATLEAAHIRVSENRETDLNESANGILLRADIHALFDSYLITLSEDGGRIEVSTEVNDPSYEWLRKATVYPPSFGSAPSPANIADHRQRFKAATGRIRR